MSDRTPIALTPTLVELDSEEFRGICKCSFADSYVGRLLRDDIPQRVQYNEGRIWIYRDPANVPVGFGTFDVCEDYRVYTVGEPHPYIPLLAVKPDCQGRGHGQSIVRHLIGEAAIATRRAGGCHGTLFLDVYADNATAIRLYERCGFSALTDHPLHDTEEGDREYIVMVRRMSTESAPGSPTRPRRRVTRPGQDF